MSVAMNGSEIIQSIIRWFEIAKPEPTKKDVLTQIGCHFEEVSEMTSELGMPNMTEDLSNSGDWFKSDRAYWESVDEVKFLDALCDQIVTAIGVGVLLGYDMEKALAEVDRSNWTKFTKDADGRPVPYIRPDGKIGKNPETYQEPQLEPFLDRKANQAKVREKLKELLAMSDTPAPYTSEKITVERIVTQVETYEIHPEQLEAFIDCDECRLAADYGQPTGEFYSDKRRVLTNGDQE